jgi:hypothetical protein
MEKSHSGPPINTEENTFYDIENGGSFVNVCPIHREQK